MAFLTNFYSITLLFTLVSHLGALNNHKRLQYAVYSENTRLIRNSRQVDVSLQETSNNLGKNSFPIKTKLGKSMARELDELDMDPDFPFDVTEPPGLQEQNHTYYVSNIFSDPEQGLEYWVDLDELSESFPSTVKVHPMLSMSHRRAATVTLSFDFPFYGHMLRNVTIATGGFLFTGDYMHSWLAATQYIAPLMANFDTAVSNSSLIRYADNGTHFVVQWEDVQLQDKQDAGNFTFQATLLRNGDIIFAYKQVPVAVKLIDDRDHPVKVGLSDAYIFDRHVFFIRRKTIYEYHRVDMIEQAIRNYSAIYFRALPTCVLLKNCSSCLGAHISFKCAWCESVQRCSDGTDRYRQEWVAHGCEKQVVEKFCPLPSASGRSTSISERLDIEDDSQHIYPSAGAIIGILFAVVVIAGVFAWVVYAYKYPWTSSGQILIKYRPSQWHMRNRDTGYTAASIHI